MSLIKVNDIQTTTGLPNRGKVLQVVQTTKTDTFSSSSTAYVDITGMSVTITPSSNSSKVLVVVSLNGSMQGGGCSHWKIVRGSTDIAIADASGSRTRATGGMDTQGGDWILNSSMMWYDNPATTSSTTYKLQLSTGQGPETHYINRTVNDADAANGNRSVSTITVMEIAA